MDNKITVRVSSNIRTALERVRDDNPMQFNSTQAACRHIIADWLQTHAYLSEPRAVAPAAVPTSASNPDDLG
jgi:hypothetical protein